MDSRRLFRLALDSSRANIAILPLLLCVLLFVVIPLVQVGWGSIGGSNFDFSSYLRIFTEPVFLRVLRRTFEIGLTVTTLCILFGYPVAYLLTVVSQRTAVIMTALIMVPLLTGVLIRLYAWIVILGRRGILNHTLIGLGVQDQPIEILHTSTAVYIGMVHVLSPIAIFTMYSNMVQIDRSLIQAAGVMGANPVRSFLRIYLPMSLPGVMAAFVLTFVISIGYFTAPMLLGATSDTMIAQLITTQVNALLDFQMGYALAITLLLATIVVLCITALFIPLDLLWTTQRNLIAPAGRRAETLQAMARRGLRAARSVLVMIERGLSWLLQPLVPAMPAILRFYSGLALFFLVCPILVVFLLSFSSSDFLVFPPPGFSWRWYEKFLQARDWHAALWFSIELACVVAIFAVVVGSCGAFAFVRGKLPGRRGLFLLTLSPLIIPEIMLALALYLFESKIRIYGTFFGLAIGHAVLAIPYVIVVMTVAIRSIDPDLEHAAAVHGASSLQIVRRLLIPLLRPSLLTSAFFAFLVSFDLLLTSIFLIGRQSKTLPLKFWADIKFETDPLLSAASSLIITTIVICVVASQWWRSRQQSRLTQQVSES